MAIISTKKFGALSYIGELLPVLQESNNVHDRRAVAVFSDVNIAGHVPRELSRIFWFFLDKYTPID